MSRFLTLSKGIAGAPEVAHLLGNPVRYLNRISRYTQGAFTPESIIIGWGMKENTRKAQALAEQHHLPYWGLEDGFISYLGHPALGDRRFSLIVDKTGVYYDGTCPSDIENLLNFPQGWLTPELTARAAQLLATIRQHQISKYNHEPITRTRLKDDDRKRVLVVDQTYGDCSVKFGMADESSFKAMLDAALTENPDAEVWIKVHPDVVLGKKKGYFDELIAEGKTAAEGNNVNSRIRILADKVNAQSLFPGFDKVYVVTSQLGFEALWYGKDVVCFGLPFYSGWGLTDDRIRCSRRTQKHSIESLFAAACLLYTCYIDPETGEHCELEDVIELIALQRRYQVKEVYTLYAVGFSLWKRAFMQNFISGSAGAIKFVKDMPSARAMAKPGDGLLVWGAKYPEYQTANVSADVQLWRAEDAFIRSVGLGADLRRPGSMVIDKQGIYFDCTRRSDLEQAINTLSLTEAQRQRGKSLRRLLVQQRISKYNLTGSQQPVFSKAQPDQQKILVTGQVDSDASLQWGSPKVTSNLDLLKQVRQAKPDAYIVYKPHPDVLLAGRPGYIAEEIARKWVDHIVCDGDIFDCITQCDELHVMTSLAGFEALIQGKPVHCWGMPFYGGWGVTTDYLSCERRQVTRTLDELVYFAHCYYPRYINWKTRRFTTPERMIRALAHEAEVTHTHQNLPIHWVQRNRRKVSYLLEAFSGRQV